MMTTRQTAQGEIPVPVASKHPFHAAMFQTLDLLAIDMQVKTEVHLFPDD